jgi:hypothetical protein
MVKVLRAIGRSEDGLLPRDVIRQTYVQGDTGKLAAWGLVSKSEKDHKWRILPRGRDFLGGAPIPSRVLLYQGIVIGHDYSKLVTITDIAPDFNLERDVLSASAVRMAETS